MSKPKQPKSRKQKKVSSQSDEYEKLRAIWYDKLAKSGFDDIEQDDMNLRVWSSRFFARSPMEVWQAKAAYYTMAERFLNEYSFANSTEKSIWRRHSEGMSIRDIVTELNKRPKKTHRNGVWQIVNRLATTMKNMYLAGHENSDEQ